MERALAGPHARAGVTLIEASISLTVLAIIIASAAPSFAEAMHRRRIEGIAAQARADLQYARTVAVTRRERLRISFFDTAAGTGYVIHSGSSGQCTVSDDGNVHCEDEAVALKTALVPARDGVRVQGNPMGFDPFLGTVTPTGTLKVIGAGGREIHQTVNSLGRVKSCSPHQAMSGYALCPR